MRPGIRLQLLLALSALLLLAFVPLFFAVAGLTRASMGAEAAEPLLRLVALYTAGFAVALLVFSYAAMTRLVVRPIERLASAAERVADAPPEPPGVVAGRALREEAMRSAGGGRELAELGESLARMTERLRADEASLRAKVREIEGYAESLKRAQESLVRSERLASVGRLAAGLAHEIGNPLSAILGFQELLLAGGLDEAEARDFLARMKRETERIHRVLQDLLDFARPEARAASSPDAPPSASVLEAASEVLALMRPQKSFRDLDLAIDIPEGLPPVALARGRLVQILVNLLLNAADALAGAPSGKVRVSAEATEKGVRLLVDDSGPGIDDAVRETLFEPFVTTKPVGAGTGLGLAVCRGIVEAAGGAMSADRSPIGGARFSIDLPASRLEDGEHR